MDLSIKSTTEPPCKKARVEEKSEEELQDPKTDRTVAAESVEPSAEADSSSVPESPQTEEGASKQEKSSAVTEKDVGITEYVSSHEGFTAIIKQRYSDFIVNEVDLSGEIVHLTTTDAPVDEASKEQRERFSLDKVFSEDTRKQLEALVANGDKSASVLITAPESKEDRTAIHQALRLHFIGLESTTFDEGGTKKIKVFHKKPGGRKQSQRRGWPSERGDYCRFVLYKENKDTMEAINLISKLSGLKASMFQYAGTKDKRSKSSQEITVYRVEADRLREVNVKLRNMAMGNFRYVKEALKLGQLKGNHFTIVLRNVEGKEEVIEQALTWLRDKGCINYYGMQRFGTTSIPTHHIGRALLLGDWKTAVELILKPREGGSPETEEFRELWWKTQDAEQALKKAPPYCHIEKDLLRQLSKHGAKAYTNALQAVTRNTRLMYVHSYQSFVWNCMVSRRIRDLGLSVVEGDLVLLQESPDEGEGETPGKVVPTVVTAENKDKFSIYDVVLPQPGHDVLYPKNEVESWYKNLLESDGLSLSSFKQQNKDYSLPGAYRRLLVRPANMTWRTLSYDDYTLPLTFSDLDKLQGVAQPDPVQEGRLKAICLEMTLPSSCYATMALRELLRADTSSGHQSTLNVT